MAVLLKRQLVLPAALCDCRERGLTQLAQCEGEAVAPFGCPLTRGLALPASLWQRHPYLLEHNVTLRPASLLHDRSAASERVRTSHMRVLLPDGTGGSEPTRTRTPTLAPTPTLPLSPPPTLTRYGRLRATARPHTV